MRWEVIQFRTVWLMWNYIMSHFIFTEICILRGLLTLVLSSLLDWGLSILKLSRSIWSTWSSRSGILVKEGTVNKLYELWCMWEINRNEPKKVDEIFICEDTIIDSLELWVSVNGANKMVFIGRCFKRSNESVNRYLFLVRFIQKRKSPVDILLCNLIGLPLNWVDELSIIYLLTLISIKLSHDNVDRPFRQIP